MQEIKIGTYLGAGVPKSVNVGFAPEFIEAVTDQPEIWKWQSPQSSGVATGIRGASGSLVRIESKGYAVITDAMKPGFQGFIAGSSVAVNNKTYYYRAMRNG